MPLGSFRQVNSIGQDGRAAGAGQAAEESGRVVRRRRCSRRRGIPAGRAGSEAARVALEVMSVESGEYSAEYKAAKAKWDQAELVRHECEPVRTRIRHGEAQIVAEEKERKADEERELATERDICRQSLNSSEARWRSRSGICRTAEQDCGHCGARKEKASKLEIFLPEHIKRLMFLEAIQSFTRAVDAAEAERNRALAEPETPADNVPVDTELHEDLARSTIEERTKWQRRSLVPQFGHSFFMTPPAVFVPPGSVS